MALENRYIWMGYQYMTSCTKIYYIKIKVCSYMEWKCELKGKKEWCHSLVMTF